MSGRRRERWSDDAARGGVAPRASWLLIAVGAAVVIGAGLWVGGLWPSGSGAERASSVGVDAARTMPSGSHQMPAFITSAGPRVQEAYTFAASHGDEMTFVPCYCGCGEHSGHRWVRDCFVKEWATSGIKYDSHGAGCDICVSIALDVKTGLGQGQPLSAIRKYIDAKYSKYGPGTNTPLPPG